MARDPLFFSARPGSRPHADPLPGGRDGEDAAGIRRQASEIIRAVLADPAPGQGRARAQLREHVTAHPGQPEKALAEHLMSLRSLTGFAAVSPAPLPPVVPSGRQPPLERSYSDDAGYSVPSIAEHFVSSGIPRRTSAAKN